MLGGEPPPEKSWDRNCLKWLFDTDDCISELPNDVLVTILSRLTLKEAVVTSLLSRRRWYLWTNVGGSDFDANNAMDMIHVDPKLWSSERPKYINGVNWLRQHRRLTLDADSIASNLDMSSRSAIYDWVKFAIAIKFQRLELKCVNVSDKALDCFLSCPVLHYVSKHGYDDLKPVKIIGSTLMLKYLEVVSCLGVDLISKVHFVSFSYLGSGIGLITNHVSMLDEISIGKAYSGFL